MNRSERYAAILVFAVVLGSTLFFSALLYMANYHTVTQICMTVSVNPNGYLAQMGVKDNYPFMPSKSQFFGEQLAGGNASQIIQWALDNTKNGFKMTKGNYHLNGTIILHGSFYGFGPEGVWFIWNASSQSYAFRLTNFTGSHISGIYLKQER